MTANPPREMATLWAVATPKTPRKVAKAASLNPKPFQVIGSTVTITTMGRTEANCQKLACRFTALETEKKRQTKRSWERMLSPNPTPAPTGTVVATYTQSSGWGTGFTGAMKIKNTGTKAITGWTMEFDLKANIVNIWNAVIVSHVGTHYVIKNADWNGTIAAGAEISFGFQAEGIAGELPSNKKFNGVAV